MNGSNSVNQTYVRKYETLYRNKPASLIDIVHRFGSEEICRDYLEHLRWPEDKVVCPRCSSESISEISTRDQYDCNACRYRFSVTSGTILDNTKLPLWKWFAAVFLMIESKKAISANQMKRTLGVTYKTAWFLCHRIREAMITEDTGPALVGIIEIDETMIKGRRRHREVGHRNSGTPGHARIWVAGAIQRDGQVRLKRVPNVRKNTLRKFIKEHIHPDAEAVYTDKLKSYVGMFDGTDIEHKSVNHGEYEWVVGDVHTNHVENVWSLLKRSIMGAFHKVTTKHLDRYLEELEFRFNNRDNPYMFRDVLLRILDGHALRYKELIA